VGGIVFIIVAFAMNVHLWHRTRTDSFLLSKSYVLITIKLLPQQTSISLIELFTVVLLSVTGWQLSPSSFAPLAFASFAFFVGSTYFETRIIFIPF
jgi:hypothetical protein